MDDLFGRGIEPLGVGHEALEVFEDGRKIEAVADALVGVDGIIHIFVGDDGAVVLDLVLPVFAAESDEDREVAEVIEMVDDRRDAERTHRREEDRAVERADLKQELRQEAEIVDQLEQPDCKLEQHAGDQ